MPYLELDNRKLYYEMHGQGEPLVLLHHGFGSLSMWKDFFPPFTEAGYQVLAYDRRGYGQSDPGEDFEEFYLSDSFRPQMIEDLEKLLDALGLAEVHLVAQCEGGVIGVDLAVAHPDRVRSLVLGSVQAWSLKDMLAFNQEKFSLPFAELDPDLRQKITKWHGPDWAGPLYDLARLQGGAYGSGFFDLRPQLSQVQCPTLVIFPDRSALFDVEQGVAMYRCLPRGELAVMPYCGHNIYEYRPDQYLRHILDFHKRVAERPAKADSAAAPRRNPFQTTCAS